MLIYSSELIRFFFGLQHILSILLLNVNFSHGCITRLFIALHLNHSNINKKILFRNYYAYALLINIQVREIALSLFLLAKTILPFFWKLAGIYLDLILS